MRNINLARYHDAIGLDGWIRRHEWFKRYRILWLFHHWEIFTTWLITGPTWYKVTLGPMTVTSWRDDFHLLSKLCRYQTWDDVRITWWDKIRFYVVTGYKFES